MSDKDLPRAPEGLGPAGRAFWRKIVSVYDLAPAEVALLGRACRTLDALSRIDAQLRRETLIVRGSSGQPRANPLLAAMADQQRALATLIMGMALPFPDEEQGRRRSSAQVTAAQERWRRERGRGPVAG